MEGGGSEEGNRGMDEPGGKRMNTARKSEARGETYAVERCEEGMKMTQFVLSSCEKRM